MFWYVHLAFSVPGTLPLVYRTKPIFNACRASEAIATDALPAATTKLVSNVLTNNDLRIEHLTFVRAKQVSLTPYCRPTVQADPTGTVDPLAGLERELCGPCATSVNRIPTVDRQCGARDEVSSARGEENGRSDDFVGSSPALGGRACDDFVIHRRATHCRRHIRFDPSGRDGIDLDVVWR